MSIMDDLRQYFCRFPEFADRRLNLDCLASDPDSYSIDSVPAETIVKRYCDGATVRRLLFTISGRNYYGTDLAQQDENTEFFDKLSQWIDAQQMLMRLPDLGEKRTARSLTVLQSGYPIEVEGTDGGLLARYQAQLELIYLQEV